MAAITVAVDAVDAIRTIAKMDKEICSRLLELTAPTCNHPVCWEAFKGVSEVILFCNKIQNSPEFATLQKKCEQINSNVEQAQTLHKQRN